MLSKDLAVYKDSYHLFHVALDIINKLPRELKYSLGQLTIQHATRMMEEIEKANCSITDMQARRNHIEEARGLLRIIDLHIRLCFERHAVSHALNAEYAKTTLLVGQQLTGWAKSCKRRESSVSRY